MGVVPDVCAESAAGAESCLHQLESGQRLGYEVEDKPRDDNVEAVVAAWEIICIRDDEGCGAVCDEVAGEGDEMGEGSQPIEVWG